MTTDDLIDLLAQDGPPRFLFRTVFVTTALLAVAVACATVFTTIGFRSNIAVVTESIRFLFKVFLMAALAVSAVGTVLRLGRPGDAIGGWILTLGVIPVVLMVAVAMELYFVPPSLWSARLVGDNARFCLTMIPMIALGPLALFIAALRQGAPAQPGLAGAFSGLAAGAIAATFYALHCTDDSPLFVATWYPLAILAMTGVGYLGGRRFLNW
jgi:hypothetical protein